MQIDRVLYPIETLGPGKRIGIWTIGCPHHCHNCSNPELWALDDSRNIAVETLMNMIKKCTPDKVGITITGGEPFYQADDLLQLLTLLKKEGYKDTLVYTGFQYETIKEKYSDILDKIDVLIDGKYIDKLNDDISLRGSSNQIIHIFNKKLKEQYDKILSDKRYRQNFIADGKIISVGIPAKQ